MHRHVVISLDSGFFGAIHSRQFNSLVNKYASESRSEIETKYIHAISEGV